MKKLLKGIAEFRKNSLESYRYKFSKLASYQSPDALFVACCDSRVVPNVFASSDPGDLFVVRNIGNLVPPYSSQLDSRGALTGSSVGAAIEYSLSNLNVKDIIICGHSKCGAMEALIKNRAMLKETSSSLEIWLEYALSSYKRFENLLVAENETLESADLLSRVNVLQQLDNLRTYPLVRARLEQNKLRVHGWWFDIGTADVYHYDQKSGKFVLIDEEEAESICSTLE